MALSNHQFLH